MGRIGIKTEHLAKKSLNAVRPNMNDSAHTTCKNLLSLLPLPINVTRNAIIAPNGITMLHEKPCRSGRDAVTKVPMSLKKIVTEYQFEIQCLINVGKEAF